MFTFLYLANSDLALANSSAFLLYNSVALAVSLLTTLLKFCLSNWTTKAKSVKLTAELILLALVDYGIPLNLPISIISETGFFATIEFSL